MSYPQFVLQTIPLKGGPNPFQTLNKIGETGMEITVLFLKAMSLQKYILMKRMNLIHQTFKIFPAAKIILKIVVWDIEHHT